MDKKIISYLKEKKEAAVILILLALGLILLFLSGGESDAPATAEVGLEERISEACSGVEGVGECSVYIYYTEADARNRTEDVESVIVVCEGADSPEVRLRLTEMLSSFFGIGANRVRVEKMRS